MRLRKPAVLPILAVCLALAGLQPQQASANTELHWQLGRLDAPSFASGRSHTTHVLTFTHASADQWTHRFFFIDYLRDGGSDGFNDNDFYGEFFLSLSLSRLTGIALSAGPVKDIGLQLGINMGAEAKILKLLPGVRLNLDLPGFAFAALELNAYLDRSIGLAGGGAPAQSDSWHANFVFGAPFMIARQRFSLTGHVEYIASRKSENNTDVSWWMLAQPQFRWDIGHALGQTPAQWFLGVEWQVWLNKLGDPRTDENAPQLLVVWRF